MDPGSFCAQAGMILIAAQRGELPTDPLRLLEQAGIVPNLAIALRAVVADRQRNIAMASDLLSSHRWRGEAGCPRRRAPSSAVVCTPTASKRVAAINSISCGASPCSTATVCVFFTKFGLPGIITCDARRGHGRGGGLDNQLRRGAGAKLLSASVARRCSRRRQGLQLLFAGLHRSAGARTAEGRALLQALVHHLRGVRQSAGGGPFPAASLAAAELGHRGLEHRTALTEATVGGKVPQQPG